MQNNGPGQAVVCSEASSDASSDPDSGSAGGAAAMAPVLCIVISQPEDVPDLKAGFGDGGPDIKSGCAVADGGRDEAAPAAVSRCDSEREQCRVCQVPTEEPLMDLGCRCRGELAKAHRSCIDIWFQSRGSNKCEICQEVTNVPSPESHPSTNDWVWRVSSVYGGAIVVRRDRQRRCFNPLWVAFAILIGGLSLDVLLSISLGVSALPVNIIIERITHQWPNNAMQIAFRLIDRDGIRNCGSDSGGIVLRETWWEKHAEFRGGYKSDHHKSCLPPCRVT